MLWVGKTSNPIPFHPIHDQRHLPLFQRAPFPIQPGLAESPHSNLKVLFSFLPCFWITNPSEKAFPCPHSCSSLSFFFHGSLPKPELILDSFPFWIPQLQTLGRRAALTFSYWIGSSPPARIPILLEFCPLRMIHMKNGTKSQVLLDLRAFQSSRCFQTLPDSLTSNWSQPEVVEVLPGFQELGRVPRGADKTRDEPSTILELLESFVSMSTPQRESRQGIVVGCRSWSLDTRIGNSRSAVGRFSKKDAGKHGMDGFGWSNKQEEGFVWIQHSGLDLASHLSPTEKNPWIKLEKKEGIPLSLPFPNPPLLEKKDRK